MKHSKSLILIFLFSLVATYLDAQCISLKSAVGTDSQTVCINNTINDISYDVQAGVTSIIPAGLPAGVTGNLSGNVYKLSGTPSVAGIFGYTLTTAGSCIGSISGTITVNENHILTLISGSSTNAQTLCINIEMANHIVYQVAGGATGAYATGLPTGVTGIYTLGVFIIEGTPAVAGNYNYTVTTSGGVCTPATATGSINVLPDATISLNPTGGSNVQTVCQNTAITDITYQITGGTGATVSGLPEGISGSYNSGAFRISGTPSVSGIFNYTVKTTGPCVQPSASGTITVNPVAGITLTSAIGTNAQTVCINSALTNITYSVTGGGSGASATGLPAGVTGSYSGGTFTIRGTPLVAGIYNYTVTTSGTCSQTSASGSITVNPNTSISLTSGTGSNVQSVCQNNPMTNVTYQITGGAGATVTGLPGGVTGSYNSEVFTISGTPTVTGTFNYIVTTTGQCVQATASGTITVNLNAVIILTSASGTNAQSVCLNSALTNITYQTTGATGVNVTGLPAGVTGLYNSGVYTIRGIPTVTGTFNYAITTTGTCTQASATGSITVVALPLATAANNGPVCVGGSLILSGGPAGMSTYLWSGPNGFTSTLQSPTVSLTATAAMAGIYSLTVTSPGGCVDTETTTVVVNALPLVTAANNGPACVGAALSLTGGPSGMSSYSWRGPNSFSSTLQSPQVSDLATLNMAGAYTLTVINLNGCTNTISTSAEVYNMSVSNAGTGGTECDLNFVLNAVPSVGAGLWTMVTGPDAATATFSPDATVAGATATVSDYGTYTFRWTETNGPCSSSSVITVNFYQQPVANAGTNGNECDLNHVLNAVQSVGTGTWTMTTGTGTATFSPNANNHNATVSVSTYGTKVFTWTEVNGACSSSSTVTVNFYQQPVATPGTGGNICGLEFIFNATPSIGSGTWARVSGPGSASFYPSANTPGAKVTVSTYGTYVFSWTELNGTCSNSANISVTFIQQPSANAGNGGDECDKNFVLNAVKGSGTSIWTKVNGPGIATFSNASLPNATVTVTQFGSYDFAWTETNSLCTSSDIVRVTFHDLPSIDAGNDLSVCKGSNIQLSATGTGKYLWSPANLLNNATIYNPMATPVSTTLFTVNLTDQFGCKNSDQVNVEVRVQPVAEAGPDQTLEYMFETSLAATPPETGQTGEWSLLDGKGEFSDINNYASVVNGLTLGTNSFIWTLTNGVCPLSRDTVDIMVHNLIIPSLITPNGDSKNEFFVVHGIETLGKTSLIVFNRWGARVFENPNYNNKWNGVDENENPLQDDTYFYILKPEKSKAIKGYIVIRR